jgi:hypothetical protein
MHTLPAQQFDHTAFAVPMNLIQKYFRTIPAHITLQQMNININSN